MKDAPCLLCTGLDKSQAWKDCGYCWKKNINIHKPTQRCAQFHRISDEAIPWHIEFIREKGTRLLELATETEQASREYTGERTQ